MALSKGCTIGLIVVGVIIVLMIIGAIFLWIYKDKIMEAGIDYLIDNTETQIVADLPDGYTEDSVHQIMLDLKAAIKNGEIDGADIQKLGQIFQTAMADKTIDQEEGAEILKTIQKALGQEPPEWEEDYEEIPDSLQAFPDSV